MKSIIEYKDEYKAIWSEFIKCSPEATIAHDIGWKDAIAAGLGHRPRYLMAMEGTTVTGALPLFLVKTWWQTRYFISLPWIDYGGICANDPESVRLLLEASRRMAQDDEAEFIEFRSVKSHDPDLLHRQDKFTFLLELDRNPDEVWKGFDAKLKNQIRKSQKSELTVEFGGLEKLTEFYRVFARKMRDLGTPVWGRSLFSHILTIFKGAAEIVLVKRDRATIAAGLVLFFKDRLYVPSAASYGWALKYCPNHALYWGVITKGCERGLKYFDFGRSTVDSNTFNFKKQWVPSPTTLIWQYHLCRAKEMPAINPDNPRYRHLINAWRRLPLPVANFLGPKIIRNFP
jgi:FemAB-related protein (PEP-CTERM system-associated)